MRKRLLSLCLTLALCLTLLPVLPASAAESYLWPVPSGKTTSRGYSSSHTAQDITGNGGDIVATKSGTVIKVYSGCNNNNAAKTKVGCSSATCTSGSYYTNKTYNVKVCNWGYGNGVIIKHSDGSGYSMYAHMASVSVKQGATVKQGDKLGVMGSTGCSTGKHLHFELCESVSKSGTYYAPVNSINNNPSKISYIYTANPDPGPTPVTNSMVHGKVHDTDGSLSINQQAKSTANGAKQLGTIPEGKTCVVYPDKASGKWYWVEYGGVQGYAYGNYITLGSAHSPAKVAAKAATCTEAGNKEYWYCSGCGQYYSNAAGTAYTTASAVRINATGHSLTRYAPVAATCTQEGQIEHWYCGNCGKYFKDASGSSEITQIAAILPMIDHDYVDGVCTRCGEADPDYVPPAIPEVHFPQQTVYFEDQFTDVPPEQWFTLDVAGAYELGLMKGGTDGTFNPYGDVTLAETIAMASRIHSIYHTGRERFVQDPAKWYQVYLDYALENGIITRAYYNADVTHRATRAQVAEIMAAAMDENGLYPINTIADNAIPDVKTGDNAAASIYRLYRAGILNGGDVSGIFYPKTYITRAEMAAIVSRIAESNNRKQFSL